MEGGASVTRLLKKLGRRQQKAGKKEAGDGPQEGEEEAPTRPCDCRPAQCGSCCMMETELHSALVSGGPQGSGPQAGSPHCPFQKGLDGGTLGLSGTQPRGSFYTSQKRGKMQTSPCSKAQSFDLLGLTV